LRICAECCNEVVMPGLVPGIHVCAPVIPGRLEEANPEISRFRACAARIPE
jgi:hypothetical protein